MNHISISLLFTLTFSSQCRQRQNPTFDINSQDGMNLANSIMKIKLSPVLDKMFHQYQDTMRTTSLNGEIKPLSTTPAIALVSTFARLTFLQLAMCLFLLVLFAVGYKFIEQDYKTFLSLGPGGTPCSFRGYTKLSFISLFKLRDPYLVPVIPAKLRPINGFLRDLRARQGPRPRLLGVAPQRQVTQIPPPAMIRALQDTIRNLVDECPSHWYVGISAFEKHNEALFSKFRTSIAPDHYPEIAHSHSSDGSMHLTLHPEDMKIVLDKGWGERHPLARGTTWWWHWPVPRCFMIIYGPRDRAELQQIKSIIRAAAWWVSGVDTREENEVQNSMTSNMSSTTD
jgi:Family of unknown function (DUF5519)